MPANEISPDKLKLIQCRKRKRGPRWATLTTEGWKIVNPKRKKQTISKWASGRWYNWPFVLLSSKIPLILQRLWARISWNKGHRRESGKGDLNGIRGVPLICFAWIAKEVRLYVKEMGLHRFLFFVSDNRVGRSIVSRNSWKNSKFVPFMVVFDFV